MRALASAQGEEVLVARVRNFVLMHSTWAEHDENDESVLIVCFVVVIIVLVVVHSCIIAPLRLCSTCVRESSGCVDYCCEPVQQWGVRTRQARFGAWLVRLSSELGHMTQLVASRSDSHVYLGWQASEASLLLVTYSILLQYGLHKRSASRTTTAAGPQNSQDYGRPP